MKFELGEKVIYIGKYHNPVFGWYTIRNITKSKLMLDDCVHWRSYKDYVSIKNILDRRITCT